MLYPRQRSFTLIKTCSCFDLSILVFRVKIKKNILASKLEIFLYFVPSTTTNIYAFMFMSSIQQIVPTTCNQGSPLLFNIPPFCTPTSTKKIILFRGKTLYFQSYNSMQIPKFITTNFMVSFFMLNALVPYL